MEFHHIGICCKNIRKKIEFIKEIHKIIKETGVIYDPLQNAELCMLTLEDGTNLELVSGEVVQSFLKRKIEYYHLCYEVNDIKEELQRICDIGGVAVSEINPAILFNNRKVVFIKIDYGLIELLEKEK